MYENHDAKSLSEDVLFTTDFPVHWLGLVFSKDNMQSEWRAYQNPNNQSKIGLFSIPGKDDVQYRFKFTPELYEEVFVKQHRVMDIYQKGSTATPCYFLTFSIESYMKDGKRVGSVLVLRDFRQSNADGEKHSALILTTEQSKRKPYFTGRFLETPKCYSVCMNVKGNGFWLPVLFSKRFYGPSFVKDIKKYPGTVLDLTVAVLPSINGPLCAYNLLLSKYVVQKLAPVDSDADAFDDDGDAKDEPAASKPEEKPAAKPAAPAVSKPAVVSKKPEASEKPVRYSCGSSRSADFEDADGNVCSLPL